MGTPIPADYFPHDFFPSLLDESQIGLCVASPVYDNAGLLLDFQIDYINTTGAGMVGLQPTGMIGQEAQRLQMAFDDTELRALSIDVLETGTSRLLPDFYCPINNQDQWFSIRITRRQNTILLVFNDVTGLKTTQTLADQQTDLLQATLDASLSSIIRMRAIRDDSGEITDFLMLTANRAVERDLSLLPEDIIGRQLLERFPGNVESGLFAFYKRVTETGETEQTTQHYVDDHGLDGWFTVAAVRNRPNELVITFQNVTESKRNEQALIHLNQQLIASNQSLNDFAVVASHDLQEPLRKIKSFSGILLDQFTGQLGDGATFLKRIDQAADRMGTLIRDLLAFSRLSTDQATIEKVDLQRLITDVLGDLEIVIQQAGAQLRVGQLPTVAGQPLQLRQLFQNLLTNALKFMPPDRQPVVTIEAQPVERQQLVDRYNLDLTSSHINSFWLIEVSDNGIGIDAAYQAVIFQAFQRLHTRQQYPGSGIGLAIVQKVIGNHHGYITVASKSGEGTTFRVFLPA